MKQTLRLFAAGLRQTANDGMLLVLLAAPLLIGILVKQGVPLLNALCETHWGFSLAAWYRLIDGFVLALVPSMLSIISAFLLLEERDEGTGAYYQITPVRGYSYLVARLGLPAGWAFLYTVLAVSVFGISGLGFGRTVFAALIGAGAGAACALMVAALAGNRVEGLAVSKLTGLSLLGLFAVWFIPAPYRYAAAFLPSFWIGMLVNQGAAGIALLCGTAVCGIWTVIFGRRFLQKG